jgi:hypothetical protein
VDESVQGGHDQGEGDDANGAEEDDIVVSFHGCIIPQSRRAVKRNLGKISAPDHGAEGDGAEEDGPEGEPLKSHLVVCFHAPIITHSPEDARVYPKKLLVLSRCRDWT